GAALVVEVESSKIIARQGMQTAARRLVTPGSTVKPFVLMALLRSQKLKSDDVFFCRRTLRIAGKRMDCAHPELAAPLHAEEALAYSCNSYFAGMAHGAAPQGYNVAGKTGTANSSASALTHGWFAGYAPAEKPEIALVVYLEHGRGSDAAAVAQTIFAAYGRVKGR